jgi:hypothetical protein
MLKASTITTLVLGVLLNLAIFYFAVVVTVNAQYLTLGMSLLFLVGGGINIIVGVIFWRKKRSRAFVPLLISALCGLVCILSGFLGHHSRVAGYKLRLSEYEMVMKDIKVGIIRPERADSPFTKVPEKYKHLASHMHAWQDEKKEWNINFWTGGEIPAANVGLMYTDAPTNETISDYFLGSAVAPHWMVIKD